MKQPPQFLRFLSVKALQAVGALPRPAGRPAAAAFPRGGAQAAAGSCFALTRRFLCSGSHRQFKRPERSFTFETEEPTGALSPLAPGESDQCPRQGPCRLQPGYDQPGLFQGKKLAWGGSFGQLTDGQDPFPTPITNPQAQGIKGSMRGCGFTALGRATEDRWRC